ncbi:hypothetical protein [Erythrobacter crassostreae]|uniref:Uncharacterized protein n=1 Tax=Erythrobacter crassostreae TaxID=2828328 RepID=A0A9X1F204_9SPHN|nr:hypothetical protein [Erythrobacter crassostrea]MBV7258617.1 hypothetical protein [Erythrobacter crassostrea]
MSLTYEVAVPKGKWPSFGQMNAALQQRGYPLRVLLQGDQQLDDPMQEFDGFLSFHVEFMGEFQEMEVYCAPYGPKGRDTEDTNEHLEQIGSDHRVQDGDYNMNVGFSPSIPQKYFAPYCLLMGTLVRDFGGYGYEGQGPSFGRMDWAKELLDSAEGIVEYEQQQAKNTAALAREEADAALVAKGDVQAKAEQKRGFPLWRTLALIVVALLVAEFVDKNIYNFTGTGA